MKQILLICAFLFIFVQQYNGQMQYQQQIQMQPQQFPQFAQIQQGISLNNCPCAANHICPSCNGMNTQMNFKQTLTQCDCAPPCSPCSSIAKSIKYIHETAANEAQQDAVSQLNLMKQSELQAKLFALAQKYAEEANAEETRAKKAAIELQECSSRAQIARNKMHRAVIQAKQLALRTYYQPADKSPERAISINPLNPTIVYNTQAPIPVSLQNQDATPMEPGLLD